ncbi:MAG: asparaginase domain-containing protein [Candidatus Coproplasma sp.]
MKKRILVVFTGGTIGSDTEGENVSLDTKSRKMLLSAYRTRKGGNVDVEFDEVSPVNVLSENVQPSDLKKVYDCVAQADASLYDGIIITHGTDTLCFTVNWFSQVFCDYPLPIVFVSALYPLTDSRSNGVTNFSGAVDFIEKTGLHGVYCSFANEWENCKIHLGSRLTYPSEISGHYYSALNAYLAEIINGEVVFNQSPYLPTLEQIRNNRNKGCSPSLSGGVILITMRSLLNFAVYDFSEVKPKAVIIELSHSGTICTQGDSLNFLRFADYCQRCGVQVIIGPVMSRAKVYDSMRHLPENVKISYDLTIEMTVAKVMSALGANLSADAYFNDNLAFEKINFPL